MKKRFGMISSSAGPELISDQCLRMAQSVHAPISTGVLFKETSMKIVLLMFGKTNSSLCVTETGQKPESAPTAKTMEIVMEAPCICGMKDKNVSYLVSIIKSSNFDYFSNYYL
jgi:hypothetical protein